MNWPMPSPDHNMEGIKEELGDLLLHVVFYSKLGEEAGRSTMRMWPTPCATNWYTAIRTFTATSMPIRPTK